MTTVHRHETKRASVPGPRRGAEGASNHATVALVRSGLSAPSAPSLNVLVMSMWSAP